MTLTTTVEWHDLPLDTPFGISRGTTETAENVVVRIEDDDGTVGVGGGKPTAYYGEDRDTVEGIIPDLLDIVEQVGDPHQRQRIEQEMLDVTGPRDHAAARSAVDIALYDLACKQVGLPLYRYLGLAPERTPPTSYTIGLADPAAMAERAAAAVEAGFPVLKVKLGRDEDRAVVRAVREAAPGATIRVDANGGWTVEEAIEMGPVLADHGVEFVEQPVAADDPEALARVSAASPLAVAADESCVTAEDVPAVAERVDIAVVKLDKCGGIQPALRQIHTAHAHGLDVMLGCMTESDAAIAPAAHLAPLVEHADLDGSLLLAEDAYEGIRLAGGRIELSECDRPGTGARRR